MVVNLNPGGIAGGSGGQYFVGDFDGTTFTSDDPPPTPRPPAPSSQDFESRHVRALDHHRAPRSAAAPPPATRPARAASPAIWAAGLANSFNGGDAGTGTLTSPDFTDQPELPQLPGRRRQPPPRRRHRARRHTAHRAPSSPTSRAPPGAPAGPPPVTSPPPAPWPAPSATSRPSAATSGSKLVNTFLEPRPSTGTITSPTFTISSDYIDLLVGGGNHPYTGDPARTEPPPSTCIVDGKVVATATGQDNEALNWVSWNVTSLAGPAGADPDRRQEHRRLGPHQRRQHRVLAARPPSPCRSRPRSTCSSTARSSAPPPAPNSETLDWASWDLRDLPGQDRPRSRSSTTTPAAGATSWPTSSPFADAPALSGDRSGRTGSTTARDFYAARHLQRRARAASGS